LIYADVLDFVNPHETVGREPSYWSGFCHRNDFLCRMVSSLTTSGIVQKYLVSII
jgi:hypothetical protein